MRSNNISIPHRPCRHTKTLWQISLAQRSRPRRPWNPWPSSSSKRPKRSSRRTATWLGRSSTNRGGGSRRRVRRDPHAFFYASTTFYASTDQRPRNLRIALSLRYADDDSRDFLVDAEQEN